MAALKYDIPIMLNVISAAPSDVDDALGAARRQGLRLSAVCDAIDMSVYVRTLCAQTVKRNSVSSDGPHFSCRYRIVHPPPDE